jgi:CRP-like cAMP-binding protein
LFGETPAIGPRREVYSPHSVNTTINDKTHCGSQQVKAYLIDEGTRMATICASSEVVCYALASRDFRALVEKNSVVGWKLLQRMVKMLRATREEAHELEDVLGTLRRFDDRYPG